MPTYSVTAITTEGRKVTQTIAGTDKEDARRQILARGLFPTSIKVPFGVRVRRERIKAKASDVCHLFEQLELQLAAGVLPEQAVASLKDEFPSPKIRVILREVHAALASSQSNLHQAFAMFPRTFDPDVLTIIEAGQASGSVALAQRFGDLRERLEFNENIKRSITGAIAYPSFVFFLASILIVFLLGNVFPKMIDLLFSLGSTLPPVTLMVIAVSKFLQMHFWLVMGGIVGVPVLFVFARRLPRVALAVDRALLSVPLIGDIYRSLVTALVAKNYRSLYMVGMPSPDILDLCARMVRNLAVQNYIRQVKREVIGGKPLGTAFRKPGFFPTMACMTLATGEATGGLDVALNRVAVFYEKEAKRKIETSVGILKPLVIMAAVAVVGVVLLAFFLPLVSILQNIR